MYLNGEKLPFYPVTALPRCSWIPLMFISIRKSKFKSRFAFKIRINSLNSYYRRLKSFISSLVFYRKQCYKLQCTNKVGFSHVCDVTASWAWLLQSELRVPYPSLFLYPGNKNDHNSRGIHQRLGNPVTFYNRGIHENRGNAVTG